MLVVIIIFYRRHLSVFSSPVVFMDQNRLSLLALHFIPGIGNYIIRQLVSYCGSAEQVLKTPRGKLQKIPGVGSVTADAIVKNKSLSLAEKEIKKVEKEKAQLLFFIDKNFPSRLRQIAVALREGKYRS